jgi:hypothetical protein
MRPFGILGAVVGTLIVLGVGPIRADAQFPFQAYETWKNPDGTPNLEIRSDRWVGGDFGGQEVQRQVLINAAGVPHLFLRLRQQGQTTDNVGLTFFANNKLGFRRPELVTRVQAQFKILKASVDSHCPANSTFTTELGAASIIWTAFNDGTSPGPGNRTGNHQIQIRALRRANTLDPPGVFQVEGNVCRCPDAVCTITGPPFPCTGVGLPGVLIGPKFTLQAIFDPAGASNAKFRVSVVGAGPEQTFGYPPATVPNPPINPAVSPFAEIGTTGAAADCPIASGGAKEIDVQTQVFKIKTNPEAVVH